MHDTLVNKQYSTWILSLTTGWRHRDTGKKALMDKLPVSERSWRLTASRFGDKLRITSSRNIDKLRDSPTGCKPVETLVTLHRKHYERKAFFAFEDKINLKTSQWELFVSKSQSYLGATLMPLLLQIKCKQLK